MRRPVITLLGQMRKDDPKRREGLNRIKTWIEKELRGENVAPIEPAAEPATAEVSSAATANS